MKNVLQFQTELRTLQWGWYNCIGLKYTLTWIFVLRVKIYTQLIDFQIMIDNEF